MKPEEYKDTKDFAVSIISAAIYAVIIEISKRLSLNPSNPDAQINLAIFVPAITAIIFGKGVGAMSAGGGQLFSMIGNSLMGNTSSSLANLSNVFLLLGNIIGGWTVGALRQKPEKEPWRSFKSRFTSVKTWQRIGGNTVSAIVGIGLTGSFVEGFSGYIVGQEDILNSTSLVIGKFFISSILLIIVVPITLFFYEVGDAFIKRRLHKIDRALRRLFYNSIKENVVAISAVELPERSFTKGVWTPVKIRYKNMTNKKTRFKIELISTARIQPSYIVTKEIAPGEISHQTFFVLPLESNMISLKARITEYTTGLESKKAEKETILEIRGRSYNPQSGAITLGLYSISNFLTVGVSIIWSNIVKIIEMIKNTSFSEFLNTIQTHLSYVGFVSGIEAVLFVPLIILMRREIKKLSSTLSHDLYFGAKEKTAGYLFKIKRGIDDLTKEARKSIKMYIKVALVFVTVVSAFILGVEGYKVLNDPYYVIPYPNDLMWLIVAVFLSWLIGLKGIDILRETALIKKTEYLVEDIGPVLDFKPQRAPMKGEPCEFSINIRNPLKTNGLRLQITGMDAISPSVVELPVPSNREATFKIVVTPSEVGLRDALITSYPLFSKDGKYLALNETEPVYYQHLRYDVKASSEFFGFTREQKEMMKKMVQLLIAAGSVIFASNAFIKTIFHEVNVIELIRDLSPILIAIQVPFIYVYTHMRNRYRNQFFAIKKFIEEYTPAEEHIERFEKIMANDLMKAVKGKITVQIKDKIKGITQKEIDETLIDEISELIEKQIEQIAVSKMGRVIPETIEEEAIKVVENIVMKTFNKKLKKEYTKKTKEIIKELQKKLKEKPQEKEISEKVKQKIKEELKTKLTRQIAKEKKKFKTELKRKIRKELKKKISKQLKKDVKKILIEKLEPKMQKQIEKQVDKGIIDKILVEIEKTADDLIASKLTSQLKEKMLDRRFTIELAGEMDKRLNLSLVSELEKAIGTQIEGDVIAKIQENFIQMINSEVKKNTKDMLRKTVRKQIKKYLKKGTKKIIENKIAEKLNSNIDVFIEKFASKKLEKTIDTTIDEQSNKILEMLVNQSVKKI